MIEIQITVIKELETIKRNQKKIRKFVCQDES